MAIAIEVENLSKQYRLGKIGTGSLSHDVNRWWHTVRGKEDPYLKIGEVNDRTKAGSSDYVWSLRDINFKIEQGDAVGIIGRNGAGKSTLLKILSRVTAPTTGSINIKGRVASLLEVGTGFHPELSGRENIFLNGAILGMRKAEVKRKFDEIVDFAGVERYIDTPVKRYSSGMYVRLAFGVAAHLESEILIVDEVLAVGDAEFQQKCLGKMGEVSKGEGRTVLFVSHNMAAITKLCRSGILLKDGSILFTGNANESVKLYSKNNHFVTNSSFAFSINRGSIDSCKIEGFYLKKVEFINEENNPLIIKSGDRLKIKIFYHSTSKFIAPGFVIHFKDTNETEILRLSNMPISGFVIKNLYDEGCIELIIDSLPLVQGDYIISLGFTRESLEYNFLIENFGILHVEGNDVYKSGILLNQNRGLIWTNHTWNHYNLQ